MLDQTLKKVWALLLPTLFMGAVYAQDNAILLEAENADSIGTDFQIVEEQNVTYVTPGTDFGGATNPGSEDKLLIFTVTFEAAGTYDLYTKVRVGPNGADDDSFYFARTFGERPVDQDSGWVRVNNIGNGAENPNDYVISYAENSAGNLVFKWINASENGEGAEGGTLFTVPEDALTQTYIIGSRENGLDIDKIAFGKSDLFYTVSNLENEGPGVDEIPDDVQVTTLYVDLSDSLRPATRSGSGALYGVTADLPSNVVEMVTPLKPRMYVQPARSGAGFQQPIGAALPVAQRLDTTTAEVTFRLADINPSWPYNWVGWDAWEAEIRAIVQENNDAGLTNIYGYEIWNEQHGTWNEEANGGDFFTVLWKPTYDLLREIAPDARIIGPSDSYYNRSRLEEFLTFCDEDENDCLPDVICWHELGGPQNVSANIDNYRNLERELRIDPMEISINEYSSDNHDYEGAPGVSAAFIAKFERKGVESAAISWWFPPYAGRLGSLLTTNSLEKGGGWWFYKWYGDMTGYMANVTPPSQSGDGLDGTANLDMSNEFSSIIFGGNLTGDVSVDVSGVPESFGDSVEVMVEEVPWESRNTAVTYPTLISLTTMPVEGGELSVPVEIADPLYGYRIYITPVGKMVANEQEFESVPGKFSLAQNYPNPFNPNTVISYNLPINSEVSLKVFDMLGREVARLVDGRMSAGTHQVPFNASNLASGMYMYRLVAGDFVSTKTMILIK